jgi:tetratricopeptide (TPR) repeat protein
VIEVPSFVDDRLSEAALRRVDDACARFEESWKKGERPSLSQPLAGADGPEREELLRELLRLDLHYRRFRGECVAADEYERRFPQDVAVIRAVFAEESAGETTDPAADVEPHLPRPATTMTRLSASPATAPPEAPQQPHVTDEAVPPALPTVPGYEILGLLGRGGMAAVYKARQRALKRLVALKMILPGDFASPQQLTRFRAEADAIARLRHPNIVQIHEVGEERGCPFFSLEFMEGGPLDRRVRGTPQPPRLAAGLVAVLARAMHFAHQAGVVHRDLKPGNVLLTRRPGAMAAVEAVEPPLEAFEPKISDFGLAKQLDSASEQTRSGVIIGTASYMAPEQAAGRVKDIGPAADVYSLAAILYELLTGRPPFRGATFRDTIEQVCTRDPVSVRQLQPSVARDLETICLKGLRKEPRQRYTTAQDMADDLQRWLDGQPIRARPVPRWERGWKWVRRRPALAGLSAAMVLALVGLATGLVFYALLEHQKANGSRTVQDRYVNGQRAEADGNLATAKDDYTRALATLNAVPGAAGEDMGRLLQDGLQRVSARLEELAARQGKQLTQQDFAERHVQFRKHSDAALFHAVPISAPGAVEHAVVVREAAAALAAFKIDTHDPQALGRGLDAFRPVVEPALLSRVAEECVELLLTWAESEARVHGDAGGASPALGLLDGAAALAQAHRVAASRALHLGRARCLELLGDLSGARDERTRAAAFAPTTASDHFTIALEDYRARKWDDASAACARALQSRPDHFWAQYLRVLCCLPVRRWADAEFGLSVCLEQRRDDAWLLQFRGLAYAEHKKYKEAEADFARALDLSQDPALRGPALLNRGAMRLRQTDDPAALGVGIVGLLGAPHGGGSILAAPILAAHAACLDDGERDLREAIELQPSYQAYLALAYALQERGDERGALQQLDRAVARRPQDPALYFRRARLRVVIGDRPGARQDFERTIAGEPAGSLSDRAAAAHVELARLWQQADENDRALALCDAVLARRRDYPEAQLQRAKALLALKRFDEAGGALDDYVADGGKPKAEVHAARGLLLAQRRAYGAAVAAYTRALRLKVDAETLSARGWAYLMLHDALRPALDDFEAALKLNPNDADALTGRGTALMQRGRATDVAEATAAAERALRSQPKTVPRLMACAGIYARAAGVLEVTNDPEAGRCAGRAVGLLRQAMALVPEKERAAFWRDGVLTEPALRLLQRTTGMMELQRDYGP